MKIAALPFTVTDWSVFFPPSIAARRPFEEVLETFKDKYSNSDETKSDIGNAHRHRSVGFKQSGVQLLGSSGPIISRCASQTRQSVDWVDRSIWPRLPVHR
jgi:hypothetical protein